MPKLKSYDERQLFKEPPPEPEKYSVLEQFEADGKFTTQKFTIPAPIYDRFKQMGGTSRVLNQAMLDLIKDASSVSREEPERPESDWYQTTVQVPTHAFFIQKEGVEKGKEPTKHSPTVPVLKTIDRKYVPLRDKYATLTSGVMADKRMQGGSFDCPTRLWNEACRASKYFQMTLNDFISQSIERAYWKWFEQQPRPTANAARYRAWSDRDERLQSKTVDAVIKRLSKSGDGGNVA